MQGAEEAGTVFSAAHFLYIPICIFAGVILGWLLGSRSAREEIARLQKLLNNDQDRQAAKRLAARDE